MSISKRIRIYTAEDVASHTTASSCWVSRGGKVFDVSAFLNDHPGGDDLILKYAGQNIEDAMHDKDEHVHSDSAYDMLEEYAIGRLGCEATIVDENWEATDDFHPDDTNSEEDFTKHEFLDLRKPLLMQLLFANFSKSYYLQQVHQPRHLAYSATLIGGPLEHLTVAEWYIVPLFWGPITAYIACRSLFQFAGYILPPFLSNPYLPMGALWAGAVPVAAAVKLATCYLSGCVLWTLLEYTLHRFLFHVDYYLPDTPVCLMLHFLFHGIHHYMPMDKLRLVMPPTLFFVLQYPFTKLAHAIFPASVANGLIGGAFTFYMLYDCMHYALHHTQLPAYMRQQKKYHLAHHYKNFELGFGVT
ncbi:oxidoreductase, partial [Athelia psychrophila]